MRLQSMSILDGKMEDRKWLFGLSPEENLHSDIYQKFFPCRLSFGIGLIVLLILLYLRAIFDLEVF